MSAALESLGGLEVVSGFLNATGGRLALATDWHDLFAWFVP
jgi:hypothetical protein